jgi:hypothetical protein
VPSEADLKETDLLADRRLKALALNDNVVQRLTVALLALDLGQVEESREHVEGALKASQEIISELIRGDHGEAELGPGELAVGGTE